MHIRDNMEAMHHTMQMVDRFYQSQSIEEFMRTALCDMAQYLDADTGCAFELFHHGDRPRLGKTISHALPEPVLNTYNDSYLRMDPICGSAFLRSGECSIGLNSAKLMRLSDHLDLRNQSGSMYFHEFLRPRKLEHVLGVMIRPSIPRLPVVVLGFQRAGKRPDFSENDLKFVRLLTSSLVSRVENFALHNLVQEMKRNSATASDERQTFEITLDSPHRLKVYSRHSANEASFIYSPSISYYPGLQHTMKSVCGRTVPAKDILCFLSSIGLSSVPESYQVHISPVLDKNASVKYILVAEPPQQESPVMSWAREYKMTARELEIVACIVEGLRNAEIAEKLQLSIRTVENHLRSIFSKAAVSSRTQLLHQLLVTNNVKATELRVM